MITCTVDNRLRFKLADLPDGVAESLKAECRHKNPVYGKMVAMGYRPREPRLIQTWKEDKRKGELSLPRGVTNGVREVFDRRGLGEPVWIDMRCQGDEGGLDAPDVVPATILWEHQEQAIAAVLERENCLVKAPTGSGKTIAAISLIARINVPSLIMVWDSKLFDQWIRVLTKEIGLTKKQIGQIRGSKKTVAPITVAMQQTLNANPKLVQKLCPLFGCVMADEVQRFAAKTFVNSMDAFPARYRVGWSADHTRKDGKAFLIYDHFGRVAADIKQDVLVKKQLVHDVEVRIVPTEFKAQWYVDQMNSDEENVDFGRLLEEMTQDEERNEVVRRLANLEVVFAKQVVMFSHRREHVQGLARRFIFQGTRCGVLLGGRESSTEFDRTIDDLISRQLYLAAGTYQALGVGHDIPTIDRGIACTPIHTNRQFMGQVRGRLCRTSKGKKDAVLYYLWDQHVFGLEPVVNLKRWNKKVSVLDSGKWIEAKTFIEDWNRRRRNVRQRTL